MSIKKLIIAGVIAAAGYVVYEVIRSRKDVKKGKVVSKNWEESVDVMEFQEKLKRGDKVPDGAEVLCSEEHSDVDFYSNRRTVTIGGQTVTVPGVKKTTTYTYKVREWVRVDTVTAKGDEYKSPEYPTVDVPACDESKPNIGDRKVVKNWPGKRTVTFAKEDGIWETVAVTDEEYGALSTGDSILYRVLFGKVKMLGAEFTSKFKTEVNDETEQGTLADDISAEGTEETGEV